MADFDPKTLAETLAKAKDVEKSLEAMASSASSVAEYFDIAKQSLSSLKNTAQKLGELNLLDMFKGMAAQMENAETASQKLNALKQVQSQLQAVISKGLEVDKEYLQDIAKFHSQITEEMKVQNSMAMLSSLNLTGLSNKLGTFVKNWQKVGEKMTSAGGLLSAFGTKAGGGLGKALGGAGKIATSLGATMAKAGIPFIGWIMLAVDLIKFAINLIKKFALAIFDVFKKADEAAAKFRRTIGMTRPATRGLEESARNIAIHFSHVGVTFDTVYESMTAIVSTMGSFLGYSKSTAETVSVLSAQLGVSAEKSVQVMRAFAMLSRSTLRSQQNAVGFLAALSAAGGTNLHEVMNDIAEFSQANYRFMRGSVTELAKAAVEARRMGTSLASAGKSASALLNFTQSINDEMEASVLLGQSIDLQQARMLAYRGDVLGLNKEILRLAQEADFENMDPLQVQSFARAVDKSADEIGKMLLAERERLEVERDLAKSPELRKQAEEYKKMAAATSDMAKNAGQRYVNELKTQANQARLVALTNQWNQLIQELAEEWLPVITEVLTGILPIIRAISKAVQIIMTPITGWAKLMNATTQLGGSKFEKGWDKAADGMVDVVGGAWGRLMTIMYKDIKPGSPHRLGRMWIEGFRQSEDAIERTMLSPMNRALQSFRSTLDSRIVAPTLAGRPTPPGIETMSVPALQPARQVATQANEENITRIVDSINRLRDDLLNGKIVTNVYLDSQIISETSNRATRFRRGYGVNEARTF